MKNLIKKNKVLFLAAAIVLAGGICLAVVLVSQAHIVMAADKIQTAEAEAAVTVEIAESADKPTPEETAEPQTTQDNTSLSAKALSIVVGRKEMRRDSLIPGMDNGGAGDADTWKNIEPDDFNALKEKALSKACEFSKAFFGYNIQSNLADYLYFTDTSGHRGDFIRVFTTDETIICTLAADTLDLIAIDYYFIPGSEQDERDFDDYSKVPDSDREIADNIAAVFNTTVADIRYTGGGGGSGIWRNDYALEMKNGKLARFAVMNGTLYAVGVCPSKASLQEGVYFDADVQMDPSVVKLAVEQSFKKGEPDKGDMTREQALSIYQQFLTLANGEGQNKEPKMTFYIDNSGVRENYWQLSSKQLSMDIASKSKWIVSLTCNNLFNPALDLTKIDYGGMGGDEYTDYVANIMAKIYGDEFNYVSVNAVYDGHFCTIDAFMHDGSVYEFMFGDGKLQQVMFFASEDCFRGFIMGWKADHEYINTVTGETFIPYG